MSEADVNPQRFQIHTASPRGFRQAFVHEGSGGVPLVLLHGWPETKRIWWRNIEALAAAGFEVIVPDLRGFGDSDLGPDRFQDVPSHSRDIHALVHDHLGHDRRFRTMPRRWRASGPVQRARRVTTSRARAATPTA
jgi:pimeloyl-ACP methyl ester carboxylesterase